MKRQREGTVHGLQWRLATLQEVLGVPSDLWRYHLWNAKGHYVGSFATYRDLKKHASQVTWKTGTIEAEDFTEK